MIIPELKIKVELLEVSIVLFKLSFRTGNVLDLEKDLIDLVGVDSREHFGLELIYFLLQHRCFVLKEKVGVDYLFLLVHRILPSPSGFCFLHSQLLNCLIVLLVGDFLISLAHLKLINLLAKLCVGVTKSLEIFNDVVVFIKL